jgi:Cu(I)/Ag(I) efflux system membrane fusion protein
MKMKELIQKHIALFLVLSMAVGLIIGWALFHRTTASDHQPSNGHTVYTCSMDPQVRQDHPGKCPICGMDLIPLSQAQASAGSIDSNAVMMSDEAMALANIETQVVGSGSADKEIRLLGKIQPDERLQQTQSAYVEGRIEKLFVNAVGDQIRKGQTLAIVYSPELYTAEQELVAALNFAIPAQRKAMTDAATEKLRLLNLTPAQIAAVVRSKKASPYIALKANVSGTVVSKDVSQGNYVKQGQPLLEVANLSRVWAMFQAYESDLPFISKGSRIHFTTEALPGQTFSGTVSFIEPVVDATNRTTGVRVEIDNRSGKFKPEMLLTGTLTTDMRQYRGDIVVPKSAVLWTGKRSVVYVKDDTEEQPTFMLRQVTLGPALPDSYVITDGLAEGEEVVTNGAFAIDASAQLSGKKSMMNE